MTIWLLEGDLCNRIQQAVKAGMVPSGEQQAAYEASYGDPSDTPRVLRIAGNQASIDVVGILTGAPNLMARWYGGGNTTYREIREAHAIAEADPSVKSIELRIASPGGEASSEWAATMDAIKNSKKPVVASVGTLAASAAYGIATQAGEIVAQNRMTRVGSVGVAATYFVWADEITITSTDAPDKRPDITTEAGKAKVRAELDSIHKIFADAVASGRGVTQETVNSTYGRGGMFLASEAVSRGMIDSIAESSAAPVNPTTTTAESGTKGGPMDLATLKATHPATYAQAVAEGVSQGVASERDRVVAHLTYAEASDSMPLAVDSIKKGVGVTASLQAQYLTAARNVSDTSNRAADDKTTEAALAAAAKAKATDNGATAEDTVADLVAAQLGVTLEA